MKILTCLLAAAAVFSLLPAGADAAANNGLVTKNGRKYYYVSGKKLTNAWKTVNGKRYYFKQSGAACRGTAVIDGTFYVFSSKSAYQKKKSETLRSAAAEGAAADALKAQLGDPKSTTYAQGCNSLTLADGTVITGRDGIWTYAGFKVATIQAEDGKEYFYRADGITTGKRKKNALRIPEICEGAKPTGWREEDGYYRYYKKRKLQKNKIVGSKKGGWFYVGPDGNCVIDETVQMAVDFVIKNSRAKDKRKNRLRSCYDALQKFPYAHMSQKAPAAKEIPGCAAYMLANGQGNCYRYAAASCYVARVLGYDVKMCAGGVKTVRRAGGLLPHGWCRVKTKNGWGYMDISIQRRKEEDMFLIKTYPWSIRQDTAFRMQVKNGEVIWKKIK